MANTNPQNLTAQGMGQLAEDQMKNRVNVDAMLNPGEIAQGAQMGATAADGKIAPTETFYQAYRAKPKSATELAGIESGTRSGVITSAPAESYISGISDEMASLEAEKQAAQQAGIQAAINKAGVEDYTKQVEGTKISADSKNAYISQLPPSDPGETEQEKNLRRAVESGGTAGLSAGNALTELLKLRKDRGKIDIEQGRMDKKLAQQKATSETVAFRLGQSGGSYAKAVASDLKEEQDYEINNFREKKSDFLNAAWDAALSGNLENAEQFRKEANYAQTQMDDAKALIDKTDKDIAKLSKEEKVTVEATLDNWVKKGFTKDMIPEATFKMMDAQLGYFDGYSERVFDLNQATKLAKDFQDDIKNTKDIFSILKDVPAGQPMKIGDDVYFGTQGTGTVEISGEDGHGRLAYVDQATGDIKVKDLGVMGDVNSGDWETIFVNGVQMSHNKKTDKYVPLVFSGGASGDAGWDQTISPNGVKGGQCGEFIHNFVEDYPYGVNTEEQREALVNVSKEETPRVGYVLLSNEGTTGHSAMVNWVSPDGKTIKLTESNYNGDERVDNTRTIQTDDPRILGYFSGQLRSQAESGSDLPAIAGPVQAGEESKPVPSGTTRPTTQTTGFVIPSGGIETFSGSPSEYNKAKQEEQEAVNSAKGLIDGSLDKGDISTTIRSRAVQIAAANGWEAADEVDDVSFGDKMAFQKMVKDDPWVKDFPSLSRSFSSMDAAYNQAVKATADKTSKAAADQAIITLFNKMLDPTSVVREGEYARSEQGQSLIMQAESKYAQMTQGGAKITDSTRKEMVTIAKTLYDNSFTEYSDTMDFYEIQAKEAGIDPSIYLRRVDSKSDTSDSSEGDYDSYLKAING